MSPAVPVAGTATAQDAPLPRNVTAVPLSSSPLATLPALARRLPDAGRKIALEPLAGSADALALAQLATQCANDHRILAVICADTLSTQRLAEEIVYFAPDLRVTSFAYWETLPYDHFSPHHDLVSTRLATLYQMGRHECDVVLIAAQTSLYRLPPRSYLAAHTFFLTTGETLDVDKLRDQLGLAGYTHVTQVVSPGEFSVRGGLIDLYPMGSALPYRIDRFGDEIESIKTFDVDTQRTLYPVQAVRLLPAREFPLDAFNAMVNPFARVVIETLDAQSAEGVDAPVRRLPPVQVDRRADDPLAALKRAIDMFDGRMLIVAESAGRRETMQQYFAEYGLRPALVDDFSAFVAGDAKVSLSVAPLAEGFVWPAAKLAFVTETELYANVVRRGRRETARRSNVDAMVRDLSEVRIGDPVVHEQHGIGRYLGLVTLDVGDGDTEFLELIYANDAKLYVPVSSLSLISRYSGASPDAAPLHELGSGQWEKAKKKAAEQAHDTAAELLNLYAQRAARVGYAYELKPHEYEAFAAGFAFDETPDQQAAIEAVIADLAQGKPMDRLVCGDVGFGKTEVALRAAFVALIDGKQVAMLVPTTLLAEQHFQVFSDRFAEWPFKIAEISRFRSGKEAKAVLDGLAHGRIDLVIGTDKLIQPDVKFKNLGLVIIDEEHRFGVRQKEQLKKLRAEVDVLTLTATPIPRTLAMSLEGIRDFSVIATAPEKRLAIKTFVAPFSVGIVREAALRELKRGGQIYFLHNDIDTIRTTAERLGQLLPEARIAIAHGQMGERELEHVMRDFYAQRINLLVCSTIIETGIDVPTANTMIIDRADRFGLAQLHQLRGRVGRSHHQAYAYLLTPPEEALSTQAKKRLEAIQLMEELGSGFYLAMHDLEIRGAGEVLGEEQSGEMQQIGFQLYVDMLKAAVDALKAGREPDLSEPLRVATEINLHVPALLPETYCSDVHERLVLYKRLANCESEPELTAMQEELIDRFGLPPEPTQALLACHRLRIAGEHLGVVKIDSGPERTQLQFGPNPDFDPAKLIALIQKDGRHRFAGQDRVRIERAAPTLEERSALVREFLARLA